MANTTCSLCLNDKEMFDQVLNHACIGCFIKWVIKNIPRFINETTTEVGNSTDEMTDQLLNRATTATEAFNSIRDATKAVKDFCERKI
ncbi:14237_t:CDS:2 [Dentiscutata heterogama]|uniref:14237_t:CDS:1 n=1 Tax=Dentiscutata heterogama TaxID=1316150 RepID=A0ACA9N2S9_9GLOM|nr:14237_t:CDS:2 [Dentiscutata heterogama]